MIEDLSSLLPDLNIQLPSWRLDLEREIDLIEEVARVYGYNRFANTLPTPGIVIAHPTAAVEHAVRTRLLALGFSESISSSFASQSDSDLFYTEGKGTVPLENPLSEEASLLRPSLIPGMVAMLAHNLNRDVREVRLFEQGHTFTGAIPAGAAHIDAVHETPSLSLGLTTAQPQATPLHTATDAPIFELKGAIESLLSLFTLTGGPAALTFTTASVPQWLQPGRSATALLNNTPIAHFGELSPAETQKRKLRQPIFLAQLDLAALYALPLKRVTAHDLSRFQAAERDFSFIFPDATQWHTIAAAIALPQHLRAPIPQAYRSLPRPQRQSRSGRPLLAPPPRRLPVQRAHINRGRAKRLAIRHHHRTHSSRRNPPRRSHELTRSHKLNPLPRTNPNALN